MPSKKGFAAMTLEQRLKICCLGGKKTVRRHGKKHMSRIGKIGRRKRTLRERRERKAALNGQNVVRTTMTIGP